jgi:signal transduction histidine kinase
VKVLWKPECSDPDRTSETGWLRVEVIDHGPGLSPENQAKLFNNIVQFQAKELQNGGGSGIGLWVSKGIMDLHEGAIGVYSRGEGYGSTFFIELPLLENEYHPRMDSELTLKVTHNSK